MNAEQFDKILHDTISSTVETLASKAKEYAKGDRLYNFKRAARILDTTPEKALAGMFVKHLVSVLDLIEGTLPATQAMLNEKIGDSINYLVLLKALLMEKHIPVMANGSITSASVSSLAGVAPLTEALGKINEQAIQEHKRQQCNQEATKDKPYLATKSKEARPDPTERTLGFLESELYKVIGKSPKGDFFLHISGVELSKANEVADIRNTDKYDESEYRVFPQSQIVCAF